jgi:F-type H+-transporting ATPase subunit a
LSSLFFSSDGYQPPGLQNFYLPPLFDSVPWLVKSIVLVTLSVVVILAFFLIASRRRAVVPGRLQFAGELVYGFTRDAIGRDVIGSADFAPFVPLLVTLFSFIMVNNLFGIIPLLQFPTTSKIAYPLVLAVISWVTFNYIGIKRQGFFGYFKNMMFLPGVPTWIHPILAPIELLSTIVVRPLSLTLRLFANMFSGHLLLLVFVTGTEYLLIEMSNPLLKAAGAAAGGMTVVLTFYEVFVELFQAYIFTLLTALYIAGAVGEGH